MYMLSLWINREDEFGEFICEIDINVIKCPARCQSTGASIGRF